MFKNNKWQSKTAVLMALAISAAAGAPMLASAPAAAKGRPYQTGQWNAPRPTYSTVSVPYGTVISVTYDEGDKILLKRDETMPLTLKVAENITSPSGSVLIPAGSDIVGQLQPAEDGSQFVAQELVLRNGRRLRLDARSEVVTKTEKIDRGASTNQVLKGAVIGAAAATAIAAITGDRAIATEEVLGGAGLGAIGGLVFGRKKVELISINPENDLDLTLRSPLALR
ncbi:MAG: hypothetical protein KME26_00155 [Oscillatoria princeps RMCB-10]|jgi:hypothetical protein|nr:hypothetical protein [Oscillatoria princeps RMCB-10]